MRTPLSGLKRWTLGAASAIAEQIDVAARPRRMVRKLPRARVAFDCLETRNLMTGTGTPILLPPASLVATPISPTEVRLNWQDQVDSGAATVYEQSGTSGAWTTIASSLPDMLDNYTYTATGLSPDTQYNFYVYIHGTTYTSTGWYVLNETTSNVAPATTFFPLVGSPTLTATPATSTAVNLSWSGVTGQQQFSVTWWQNPGGQVQSTVVSPATSQVQVSGLSPYTSYSFQVTADDGVNTSIQSNTPTVTTLPPSATLSASVVSATQIDASWSSVAGASDYVVYNLVNGTPTRLANAGTGTSASLKGLSPYTKYQLEVGALGPWGISYSSVVPVTTLPTAPVLSATPTSPSQINLSWNSVADTNDYVVYENTGSGFMVYGDTGTGTGLSATSLSANSTYSFKVADVGPWGVTWSNTVSPLTLPNAPVAGAKAESASLGIVAWGAVNAASFQVDENVSGVWKQVVCVPANAAIPMYVEPVTGLGAGTPYQFKVGATNASGTTWSNVVSALTFPAAPSVRAGGLDPYMIWLTWNTEPSTTGYSVQIEENGAWVPLYNLASGDTSTIADRLSPGTGYNFRVGATNASGTTWGYSATTYTMPAAPTLTALAESDSIIGFSWTSVTGANGYTVTVSSGGSLLETINTSSTQTSDALWSLKPDTTYTFQVAAFNSSGRTLSTAVNVTTFLAPATLTANVVSSRQVDLSWNSVAGATDYLIEEWDASTLSWVELSEVTGTSYNVENFVPFSADFSVVAVGGGGPSRSNVVDVTT